MLYFDNMKLKVIPQLPNKKFSRKRNFVRTTPLYEQLNNSSIQSHY